MSLFSKKKELYFEESWRSKRSCSSKQNKSYFVANTFIQLSSPNWRSFLLLCFFWEKAYNSWIARDQQKSSQHVKKVKSSPTTTNFKSAPKATCFQSLCVYNTCYFFVDLLMLAIFVVKLKTILLNLNEKKKQMSWEKFKTISSKQKKTKQFLKKASRLRFCWPWN